MKIKKKIFSLLLVLCLAFSSVISVSADTNYDQSTSNLNYSRLSVEYYKDWIQSQVNTKHSNSYEAQNFLKEFNNLTKYEQELFVSYLNDSDLILEILNLISSNKAYTALESGNIIVSNNQTFQNEETTIGPRATMQYRLGEGTSTVTIFGIEIFQYSGEIRYSHNGSSIKEISHANIWISKNWIPFTSFSWDDASTYGVGTTVAHHIEYCTWSFVHPNLGLTYGTHQIEITGSTSNKTTFTVS